jgi:hypothetical protein
MEHPAELLGGVWYYFLQLFFLVAVFLGAAFFGAFSLPQRSFETLSLM